MDDALIVLRAVQFVSALLAFGVAAFPIYTVAASEPQVLAALDTRLRFILVFSATVALLSAIALVPITGSRMAGSAAAALDVRTISTVLLQTSFGRVWCWHLLASGLLVAAGVIRHVRPGYRVVLARCRSRASDGSAMPQSG